MSFVHGVRISNALRTGRASMVHSHSAMSKQAFEALTGLDSSSSKANRKLCALCTSSDAESSGK